MATKCGNSYVPEIASYVGTQFVRFQRWCSQMTPTSTTSLYFQSRLTDLRPRQSVQVQRRGTHTSPDSGPKSGNDNSEGKKFPSKEFKDRFYTFLFGAGGGAVTAWQIFKYIYSNPPSSNWPKFIRDWQDALHHSKREELLEVYHNFNLVKKIHLELKKLNVAVGDIKYLEDTGGLDKIIGDHETHHQDEIKKLNEIHANKINDFVNKQQKELAFLTDELVNHRKNTDGELERCSMQLGLYKECKDEKCLGDVHKFLTEKTIVNYEKSRDFSPNFGSILQSALKDNLNPAVTILSFNQNSHIRKNDGFKFIYGLKDNTTIETLRIAETNFGYGKPRDEVKALVEMLETNQHLKHLNLYGTYIDQGDLEPLKSSLTKNKTLRTLNLGNTYLKPEELTSLEKDINKGRDESARITIEK